MGASYSSLVFQPPQPPTYSKVDQCIQYRRTLENANRTEDGVANEGWVTKTYNKPLIWLYTKAGSRIPAVFFRAKDAILTVLISHSNDEDLGMSCTYAQRLCKACGVNVFCYEYSGYGISSGQPSEKNCYSDIDAAYEYLIAQEGLIPEQIILLGRSLGSGPACELAMKSNSKAVVLVSPILSVLRLEKSIKKSKAIPSIPGLRDMFENINKVSKIPCPILFVHGRSDKRVPLSHSIELWAKTLSPVTPLYTDAGHDDVESVNYDLVFQRYTEFFDSLECPVMENVTPEKKKASKLKLAPLVKSAKSDVSDSSHSTVLGSLDRSTRTSETRKSGHKTRIPFVTPKRSFADLQQVAPVEVISSAFNQTSRPASRQVSLQASRQASRQSSHQASRQASTRGFRSLHISGDGSSHTDSGTEERNSFQS